MKRSKKGFTLAELLIVVAIIAILVAIAIPVFNGQLEKSRNAVDEANIRSAYAEAAANALTNNADNTVNIAGGMKSTTAFNAVIGGKTVAVNNSIISVTVNASTGTFTLNTTN